jgi:hypothetical protein
MNREDDHALWDLLGQTRPVEVSPFFSRNILRRIREDRFSFSFVAKIRSWKILAPLGATATAIVAIAIFVSAPARQESARVDRLISQIDEQDYDVITNLDELVASEESNVWADNSSSL